MSYNPPGFWDKRIRKYNGSLLSVGNQGLSTKENAILYGVKEQALTDIIHKLGLQLAGLSVLDGGCGTGYFSLYYEDIGARITGIDSAPSAVRYASKNCRHSLFIISSLSTFNCPDASFNLVHVFDVLYHIIPDREWELSLSNLHRLLRKGGHFIFSDKMPDATYQEAEHIKYRSRTRYDKIRSRLGFAFKEEISIRANSLSVQVVAWEKK